MPKSRLRPTLTVFWVLLWPLIFWGLWTPIPFSILKIALVGALVAWWMGLLILWPRTQVFGAIAAVLALSVAFWPARPVNSTELARQYVVSMRRYEGTRYVWGGENGRGLDCSGLVRRGLVDALLSAGWKQKNPSLWREAAFIWWHDCSALEMKNGYGGRIEGRFEAPNLNELEPSPLQSGDLAVLRSGVHVLAWVGGKTWIQADPNLVNGGDKVILTSAPSKNGWFNQKVVICRWKILSPTPFY